MLNKILLMLKGFAKAIWNWAQNKWLFWSNPKTTQDWAKDQWKFWSRKETTTSIIDFTKSIGSMSLLFISALAIIYLVVLAYGEVSKDTIIIEEFTVPTEFPGKGYTGKALAQELYDQLIIVQDTASRLDLLGPNNNNNSNSNSNRKISAENIANRINFSWETENIEISGEKISPNAIKSILGPLKILTHKNTYHIYGEIQEASASIKEASASITYQIIVRCNDVYYRSSVAITKENLQAELLKSAAELYQTINPNISATYYVAQHITYLEKEDTYYENKATDIINKKLINNVNDKDNYLRGQLLLAYIDYLHYRDNLAMVKLDKNIEIGDKWWLRWSYSDDRKKALSDTYYLYSLILIYALQNEDYKEVLNKLTNASELNNKNANIYATWGDVLYNLKNNDEAIKQYEKATELNPTDSIVYDNLGLAFYQKGNYDKAIQNYNISIELNPTDSHAYNNLTAALYQKSNYKEALENHGISTALYTNIKIARKHRHLEEAEKKVQ